MEKEYLNILKLNLEIIKAKNHINQIIIEEDVRNQIEDYLFYTDKNDDFKLNEELLNYNFSQYEILEILREYLVNMNPDISFNLFKDNFNKKLDAYFINLSWPKTDFQSIFKNLEDYNIIDFEFDNKDVDKIVSIIKTDNFIQESNDGNLIEDLKEFKILPLFKFISTDLSDYEKSILMDRIETDITLKKVSGEISDIIDYYFEEYKTAKKHYLLNSYLNVLIKNQLFDELIINYGYDDETILIILNNVRNDIFEDKIIDKKELIFKLRDYFKREQIKTKFYKELQEYEKDSNKYCADYNLTNDEVLNVFGDVRNDIENNLILNDSLDDHIHNKFDRMVELNQSAARIKFNNIIKQDSVVEIIHDKHVLDKKNEKIGDLIYYNQIRSNQINKKFIIDMIKEC